jgi:putative CocE/NonD family hydrolase
LAIRHGRDRIELRHAHEWPLKRTQWTKFYFDLAKAADGKEPRVGALVRERPARAASCSYPSFNLGSMGSTSAASSQVMGGGIKPGMGVALETPPLAEDTEITGPLAATFYVSSEAEDMDLFLTLRNFDADGNEVLETGQQGTPVPVAKGWLRASHRELDPALSLPYRPYHKHTRRQFLKAGEIVRVDVEIWPTSMVFKKGHRIRLDVQPRDGVGSQSYLHYHADYNTGMNTIYAGGDYESYLLLPVIPKG